MIQINFMLLITLLVGFTSIAVLHFLPAYAHDDFKAGSEPDGFRGIKWGTELPQEVKERGASQKAVHGYMVYHKPHDDTKIGTVTPDKVSLIFKNDRFIAVEMLSHGKDNWTEVCKVLKRGYGEGISKEDANTEEYYWFGNKTFIGTEFNRSTKEIKIVIGSLKYYEHINIEKERKAILDAVKTEHAPRYPIKVRLVPAIPAGPAK